MARQAILDLEKGNEPKASQQPTSSGAGAGGFVDGPDQAQMDAPRGEIHSLTRSERVRRATDSSCRVLPRRGHSQSLLIPTPTA